MQQLNGSPREGLDPALLTEALTLGRGATVRHGVEVLDSADRPTGHQLRFQAQGSEVTWSYRAPDRVSGQSDDVAAVRRQATLVVPADQPVDLLSARLRVWTEWLLLDGTWARFYLGVFVVVTPGALDDDGVRVTRTLQCADKSHLWHNSLLPNPLHVPAGTKPVSYVRDQLSALFGEPAFALTGADVPLAQPRTFEAGRSRGDVWSQLLEADGNDQLTADEVGRPASQPLSAVAARSPEIVYGAGRAKVLLAGRVEPLLPSLPNVVRFSARQGPSLGNAEGNGLRTKRNQSTGPASIAARGYEVELRVDVDADSQTVLDQVAEADAQRYFAGGGLRWQGQVGLNPLHSDRDVIGLDLPRLRLQGGAWQVTSWTYPLGDLSEPSGALMPITAERRVDL